MTMTNIFGVPFTGEQEKEFTDYLSAEAEYYERIESKPSGVCRISNAILGALMPNMIDGINVRSVSFYDSDCKGILEIPCILSPQDKLFFIAFAMFAWDRVKDNPEITSEAYPNPFELKERIKEVKGVELRVKEDKFIPLGLNAEDFLELIMGKPFSEIPNAIGRSCGVVPNKAKVLQFAEHIIRRIESYEFHFSFGDFGLSMQLMRPTESACWEQGAESLHFWFNCLIDPFFYGLDGTNWGYTEIPTKFVEHVMFQYAFSEVFVNLALYLFIKMGQNKKAGKLPKSISFSLEDIIRCVLDKNGQRYFTEDENKKCYLDVNKIKSELREAVKNLKAIGLIKDYKVSFSYKGIVLYFNYDY